LKSPRSNDTNGDAGGSGGVEDDGGVFADPVSIVKSVVGEVKQRYKIRKERERALSTVTQVPDDVVWRKEEEFEGSENEWSEGDASDGDGRQATPQQGKRWSAEPAAVSVSAPLVRPATPAAIFVVASVCFTGCIEVTALAWLATLPLHGAYTQLGSHDSICTHIVGEQEGPQANGQRTPFRRTCEPHALQGSSPYTLRAAHWHPRR
jgi:hypothetical protein